jgi:hypothetical protein
MVGMSNTVSVSMKTLLAGIAAFCVGLWAVLSFTVSGLKEETVALRTALDQTTQAVRAIDHDSLSRTNDISSKLTEQIQGLRVDLVKLDGNFSLVKNQFDQFGRSIDQFGKAMDNLGTRIDKLQAQLNPSPETSERRANQIADYLRKSGIQGQIIVVPTGAFPN